MFLYSHILIVYVYYILITLLFVCMCSKESELAETLILAFRTGDYDKVRYVHAHISAYCILLVYMSYIYYEHVCGKVSRCRSALYTMHVSYILLLSYMRV